MKKIALDRHGGWKVIYDSDFKVNKAYIADIVREVEASGSHFLEQLGSHIFVISSTSTKMNTVK